MVIQRSYSYDEALYPPALARAEGMRAPRSAAIDASKVQVMVGADGITQKIVSNAVFLGTTSTAGKVRPLPRTRLTEALVASTTTQFGVTPRTARHFIAGDVLSVVGTYATITIGGTIAQNDTFTATIAGQAVTTDPAGTSPTAAQQATNLATKINANPILIALGVSAIADGAVVYVFGRTPHSIAVSKSSSGGTITIGGSQTILQSGVTVGTVLSVDVPNTKITLTAAASVALPIGAAIGNISSTPFDANGGLGMLSPNQPIDLMWEPENHYGMFTEATLYKNRVPYWDVELLNLFPGMYLI